ncbi:hypothetical protein [Sphaerisporangium corydalis]|uniref:Uncharacterized protein n=1 Tax=Sphaerisporangium corydalis TaxID=1441875 RepID=A0ABV9ELX1_9ACTN|nr:hypothetical protein [Sphaerisporangium corydalis]
MVQRHRHQLIAVVSFLAGVGATWILSATGTDGDFFRSLLYPWMCAAFLLAGLVLGVTVSVRGAVATLVPLAVPQQLLAVWQGVTTPADAEEGGLWVVGFAASTILLVFAVGCIAIGICIRLMFRR